MIFGGIILTSQSLYFLADDNTCKMGSNYAVVLLYVLVIFVLLVLVAIAFLALLLCRACNLEVTEMQAHRWSFGHSLKRIKEFQRANMSDDSTSTKNKTLPEIFVVNDVHNKPTSSSHYSRRYSHEV